MEETVIELKETTPTIQAVAQKIYNNAFAVTVILLLFLIILFWAPRRVVLFILALSVSITVGLGMEKLYENSYVGEALTDTEKIIVAGAASGAAGFTVGYFANKIMDFINNLVFSEAS